MKKKIHRHRKDSRLSESVLSHQSSGKALGVGKGNKGLLVKKKGLCSQGRRDVTRCVTNSRSIVVLQKKLSLRNKANVPLRESIMYTTG